MSIVRSESEFLCRSNIRGFFDNMDHGWMLRFLQHQIADQRILRLIEKWLKAGISEDGSWSETTVGMPQGAVVTPRTQKIVSRSGSASAVEIPWRSHATTLTFRAEVG